MNWLRLMGALILCGFVLLLFYILISCFKCSKNYSKFFITLVCDLLLVKTLHSWCASLVYAGVNLSNNFSSIDLYILGTHMLSYVILLPILIPRIR